jgi:DNA-directed RNA polymerase specialized sigma24 family protein
MITKEQYNRLVNNALRVLGRWELAEEAVQHAVYKLIDRPREVLNIYEYLNRSVMNRSLDMRKKDEFKFDYIGDINEHQF